MRLNLSSLSSQCEQDYCLQMMSYDLLETMQKRYNGQQLSGVTLEHTDMISSLLASTFNRPYHHLRFADSVHDYPGGHQQMAFLLDSHPFVHCYSFPTHLLPLPENGLSLPEETL